MILLYIKESLKTCLSWLHTYNDPMYLVKKNKPEGKPNSGWIDNGEWKQHEQYLAERYKG